MSVQDMFNTLFGVAVLASTSTVVLMFVLVDLKKEYRLRRYQIQTLNTIRASKRRS